MSLSATTHKLLDFVHKWAVTSIFVLLFIVQMFTMTKLVDYRDEVVILQNSITTTCLDQSKFNDEITDVLLRISNKDASASIKQELLELIEVIDKTGC